MIGNIIVTGASRGVGLEITRKLLENGCEVFAVNRSLSQELKQLVLQYPEVLHVLQYDLSDQENLTEVVFKSFIGLKTPIHGLTY